MGDRNLPRELKRWAAEEFSLPAKSLPHDGYFKTLCVGPGASIWKYVTQHVYQQRNVRMMRGNVQWYKVLQDKELREVEGQGEAVRRQELQQQIQDLRSELTHLDAQITSTEDQLASEERSTGLSWAAAEDSRRRELLLRAFRGRCTGERRAIADDTHRTAAHRRALEQLAKKAEVEVVFGSEASLSSSRDELNPAVAEPQVLREVRALCEERLLFFQSLQESELKTRPPGNAHLTREERAVEFQLWLRAVEDLLLGYPPEQVLCALRHLALVEESALREKLASLDVTRDVQALRFNYESDHLLDISRQEEEELPSVKTLLDEAWAGLEDSLAELSQTRRRVQQLQNQVQALRKTTGPDRTASEAELRAVVRAAARDSVREQCQQMERRAREGQEAARNLRGQWQSILDFRQLVDARQEHIRGLIKANSTAKAELTRQHAKIGQFLQNDLAPLFGDVIAAADGQRNSVSQEARQFNAVSLAALDCRVVDGEQRIPVSRLSIHRLYSPSLQSLHQSLAFPLYKAPEALGCQVLSQHLELRFVRQLLRLHTSSLENVRRQGALLPAPDQQALVSRVVEEDQALLETLLPRVQQLSLLCSQALAYSKKVNTAIAHWWDQPAQAALPELCRGGMTLQQWLHRYKLAAQGFLPKA